MIPRDYQRTAVDAAQALMASGFQGWAAVFHDGTLWHALGQTPYTWPRPPRCLARTKP